MVNAVSALTTLFARCYNQHHAAHKAEIKKGSTAMSVQLLAIDQDILDSARLSAEDAKVELAIHLYGQRRLSLGKARELAGMSIWTFRQLLASRAIPAHYDENDLLADVETLRSLRST